MMFPREEYGWRSGVSHNYEGFFPLVFNVYTHDKIQCLQPIRRRNITISPVLLYLLLFLPTGKQLENKSNPSGTTPARITFTFPESSKLEIDCL